MSDNRQNFVMVPEPNTEVVVATPLGGLLARIQNALQRLLPGLAPAPETEAPTRPRLVFAFDATASREPAWATARQVTDALVKVLPGELDVALAVHGGSMLHTFTDFTDNANTLRDRAAGIRCLAGFTRMLPILARSLKRPGVRVIVYIGDVFEESLARGRKLADELAARGIKLIVLHDTSDAAARGNAEIFQDLARRTGGCVLPFDINAPDKLRDLLAAVAVYAVGGSKLLREKRSELPGALVLLDHLDDRRK